MKTVVATLAALFTLTALAQDSPAPDAAAAPNPADLKPRPSEMAWLAPHSLLLAITRTDDHFVAVGDRGNILLSADGEKWEQVQSPVHAALTAVVFADAQNGWAAGHDASILHTSDGGRTWALQNFQPQLNKPLLALLAIDAQHVLATGAYGLFLSTADGGKTWQPVDGPLVKEGLHINSMTKLGDGELFIAGETGLVAISRDGAQWTRLKIPYPGSLFGALPRGDKGALVYGLRGNVYVSDDVHTNQWRKVDTRTVLSFFGGAKLANGDAVLVGADGEVVRITPAGAVSSARVAADERTLGSGTLSGVLAREHDLLVVGELGISQVKEAPPPSTAETPPAPAAPAASPATASSETPAQPETPSPPRPREQAHAAKTPAPADNPANPSEGARVTLGKSVPLHGRPSDGGTTGILQAGTLAKLKTRIANPTGTWWYVSSKSGSGWVTDAELKAAAKASGG